MNDPESLRKALAQTIEIAPWNAWWSTQFERERDRLEGLLPGRFMAIEHVGSTAVQGLDAKPVIDMLIGVASMEVADALLDDLCAVGYVMSAEFNATLADRRWLMRHVNGHRTHDLHLVEHDGEAWRSHVGFRDALRADAGLRGRYLQIKRQVSRKFHGDIEAYTRAKNGFITEALLRAALVPAPKLTQRGASFHTAHHDGMALLAIPPSQIRRASPSDLSNAAKAAEQAVYAAGAHLMASRSRLSELVITRKQPGEVVQQIRREAEALIRDVLSKRFPSHGFAGSEESTGRIDEGAPLWAMNGLEGVTSYVRDQPRFAVSVALITGGEPQLGVVYDPCRNEFFGAIRGRGAVLNGTPIRCAPPRNHLDALAATAFPGPGSPWRLTSHMDELGRVLRSFGCVRRAGSMGLEMAYIAAGRIDAFWSNDVAPLEAAAGIVLLRESGALVESRDGEPLLQSKSLLACTPGVRGNFAELLNPQ